MFLQSQLNSQITAFSTDNIDNRQKNTKIMGKMHKLKSHKKGVFVFITELLFLSENYGFFR